MAKNKKKEVENLDGLTEPQIMKIFKKAFPNFKDTATLKLDQIKQRIRIHWTNKGITEFPEE